MNLDLSECSMAQICHCLYVISAMNYCRSDSKATFRNGGNFSEMDKKMSTLLRAH